MAAAALLARKIAAAPPNPTDEELEVRLQEYKKSEVGKTVKCPQCSNSFQVNGYALQLCGEDGETGIMECPRCEGFVQFKFRETNPHPCDGCIMEHALLGKDEEAREALLVRNYMKKSDPAIVANARAAKAAREALRKQFPRDGINASDNEEEEEKDVPSSQPEQDKEDKEKEAERRHRLTILPLSACEICETRFCNNKKCADKKAAEKEKKEDKKAAGPKFECKHHDAGNRNRCRVCGVAMCDDCFGPQHKTATSSKLATCARCNKWEPLAEADFKSVEKEKDEETWPEPDPPIRVSEMPELGERLECAQCKHAFTVVKKCYSRCSDNNGCGSVMLFCTGCDCRCEMEVTRIHLVNGEDGPPCDACLEHNNEINLRMINAAAAAEVAASEPEEKEEKKKKERKRKVPAKKKAEKKEEKKKKKASPATEEDEEYEEQPSGGGGGGGGGKRLKRAAAHEKWSTLRDRVAVGMRIIDEARAKLAALEQKMEVLQRETGEAAVAYEDACD